MKKSIKYFTLTLCMILLASCSSKTDDRSVSEQSSVQNEASMQSNISIQSGETSQNSESVNSVEEVPANIDSSEKDSSMNTSNATQRVGSDEFGYISVPSDFFPFQDINYPDSTDIQYSDITTTNITTMNKIDLNQIPEEHRKTLTEATLARNITDEVKRRYGNQVKSIDESSGNFDNLTYHSMIMDFSNNTVLIINILKYNDDYYYLAVEGNSAFTDTNEEIIKSFSLEK